MRMIVRAFKEKKLDKDIRSDDEEDLSSEEPTDKAKKTKTNGTTRRRKDN